MRNIIITAFLILSTAISLPAQNGTDIDQKWLEANYTKREVMIPMRDGVRLYTAVYEPLTVDHKTPLMLLRTPYSLKPYGIDTDDRINENKRVHYMVGIGNDMLNYAADGYIIVYQNVRGRFLSGGVYENIRPFRPVDMNQGTYADDATDTYDTIEWLLDNTENNGNVGVKGVSYPGFYATLAILSRHPAIKAVSPQAPVTDWFMGDDAHHNGALCLADVYRFGSSMYRERKSPTTKGLSALFKTDEDIYEYFKGKSISGLSAFFGDSLKFWNQMMQHPDYDDFWISREPSLHLTDVNPAVLVTGGFYDAEDCYGAFRTYSMIKKLSPDTELYIAAGPWYHGGWDNRTYNHMADAWFGEASGAWYQDNVEYPFFRHYLEAKGEAPARVNILPSGETSVQSMQGVPSDKFWKTYSEWPPAEMTYRTVSLSSTDSLDCRNISQAGGRKLSGKLMKGERSYISDPLSPVPYMDIESSSRNKAYMVADQSFAIWRNDVLTYFGPELTDTLHLAGKVKVSISIRLTSEHKGALDGDIIVKLIDVRPDGYCMLVRGDVMPLRYRKTFTEPHPVKNGSSVRVEYEMPDIDHYFIPGHKLMIQVQSSWFPLIAMNPQTYLQNQYRAVLEDYQPVTVSVKAGSSVIGLPVCP